MVGGEGGGEGRGGRRGGKGKEKGREGKGGEAVSRYKRSDGMRAAGRAGGDGSGLTERP